MAEKFDDIIAQVEKLSVIELADLVKALEEKFGVSAAAPVAAVAAGGGDDDEGGKDAYDVVLKDAGGQKIQVIKAIKEVLELGLKEAKDMTDGVPTTLKEGMKKEEAEAFKAKLEEAGGVVELK